MPFRLDKSLPEEKDGRDSAAVEFPGDLTQRIRDGLFRRHRVADGGGFHPTGFVDVFGAESYGFEDIVEQDTRFAVEQLPVNRILDRRAKADDGKLGDARSGGNGGDAV